MSAPMIMVLTAFAMLAMVLLIDMGGIIARRGKEIEYLRKRIKDDWEELAALRKALGYGPNSPTIFTGDKQGRMMLVTPPLVREHQKAKNRIAQLEAQLAGKPGGIDACFETLRALAARKGELPIIVPRMPGRNRLNDIYEMQVMNDFFDVNPNALYNIMILGYQRCRFITAFARKERQEAVAVSLVFDDWKKLGVKVDGNTYHELSIGDFHGGTCFPGIILLDAGNAQELRERLAEGYQPTFWLGARDKGLGVSPEPEPTLEDILRVVREHTKGKEPVVVKVSNLRDLNGPCVLDKLRAAFAGIADKVNEKIDEETKAALMAEKIRAMWKSTPEPMKDKVFRAQELYIKGMSFESAAEKVFGAGRDMTKDLALRVHSVWKEKGNITFEDAYRLVTEGAPEKEEAVKVDERPPMSFDYENGQAIKMVLHYPDGTARKVLGHGWKLRHQHMRKDGVSTIIRTRLDVTGAFDCPEGKDEPKKTT